MHKNIIWNTGPAAERARHNLKLNKKNKKKKRASSPKLQAPSGDELRARAYAKFAFRVVAPSPRTATIKKDNKT
jgi:hypothetical protein